MKPDAPKIVVCGTDTDVGKTIISSLLVQGLNAIYWKPIQSGLDGGGDTRTVVNILGLSKAQWIPETYKFNAAVSPHWAAEKEEEVIIPERLQIPFTSKKLIIEMAGGLMVPITRHYLQIDLLKTWMLPIVLVGRSGLGTLNHTLLSIEALQKRQIPIMGIILNGKLHEDNPRTLQEFSNIPIIAEIPPLDELSEQALSCQWLKQNLTIKFQKLINEYCS